MNTEQILKVLKNERECIKNNHDYCYEDCDESCPYYVSEKEKLEVYDFLIEAYSITEIHINISKEESEKLIEIINRETKEGVRLAVLPYPDVGVSYPTVTVTTEGDNGTKKCTDCEHALYFTKRDEELGIVGGCEIGFPCNEEGEDND